MVGSSSHQKSLLQTGKLDIAPVQPPLHPENFTIREQFRCPTVAVALRDLFKPGIDKLTLEELSQHPLLLLRRSEGIGSYERLMHHLRTAGLPAEVALYSSDVAILLDLLPQIPDSLAIVPATETEALPEAYGILPLDFELPDHQFSFVCLATPEGHALLYQISTSGST